MTETLTLADGTVLSKSNGLPIPQESEYVEIPSHTEIQRDIVVTKKRLMDLPLPPDKMNVISVVLMYSVMGIDEHDIAITLKVDEDVIRNIKMSDVYSTIKQELIDGLVENDLENVRTMFIDHSVGAARKMVEHMYSSNEATSMSAAKDILDRAGHRPTDIVEHRHKMEGGLTIRYVDKTGDKDIPTIDITPEQI